MLLVISIFKIKEIKDFSYYDFFPYFGIFLSFIFFYLGSTGYKHHLIFLLFFLSLVPISLLKNKKSFAWIFITFFLLSFTFLGIKSLSKSFENLNHLDEVYANYPLRQLSVEIENEFLDEYSVFGVDHTLLLFYLDKERIVIVI